VLIRPSTHNFRSRVNFVIIKSMNTYFSTKKSRHSTVRRIRKTCFIFILQHDTAVNNENSLSRIFYFGVVEHSAELLRGFISDNAMFTALHSGRLCTLAPLHSAYVCMDALISSCCTTCLNWWEQAHVI
jgi:uncharacterized membrane protein